MSVWCVKGGQHADSWGRWADCCILLVSLLPVLSPLICCARTPGTTLLQVLVKVMPMGLFRAYSAGIRGLNNIVGGISFVTIARMFGVQKSGSAAPALAEA